MYSRNRKSIDRYKGQPIFLLPDSSFPPFQKARLCKDRKRKMSEEQNVALPRRDVILYIQCGLKMSFIIK